MNILSNLLFIDHKISENMVYVRSDFLDQFFLFITKIGNWVSILIISVCILALFYIYKKRQLILPFIVAISGSAIMTIVIKYLVHRRRPGADIALYLESLPSFPSAHSSLALALFGFLIYCVWKFNLSLSLKISSTFGLAILIVLIGFSRIYLGVHFLSDVIAGYLVGLLWLIISMYILKRLSAR